MESARKEPDALIDEFFDRKVDQWCERVSTAMRPRMILFSHFALIWRPWLYLRALGKQIANAFHNISNEDNVDRFLRETEERGENSVDRLLDRLRDSAAQLAKLEAWGRTIRFSAMLLMLLLSVLGVAAGGRGSLAMLAASLCVMWLSVAVESEYAPVAGGVRQVYLVSTLLREGALLLLLPVYFIGYTAQGVPSNVVLQSAMVVMLFIHATLFLALVALNTRQPLLLRALAGVMGMAPALTAAAAAALAATCVFRPWPLPLSGAASALGAMAAFLGDELIAIRNLGGIRLRYYSIWVCLLMCAGYALMLLGAWCYAPIG